MLKECGTAAECGIWTSFRGRKRRWPANSLEAMTGRADGYENYSFEYGANEGTSHGPCRHVIMRGGGPMAAKSALTHSSAGLERSVD